MKAYSKPSLYLESFDLSRNIAANCQDLVNFGSGKDCTYQITIGPITGTAFNNPGDTFHHPNCGANPEGFCEFEMSSNFFFFSS